MLSMGLQLTTKKREEKNFLDYERHPEGGSMGL
jgi:hypothetical protein